MNSGDDTFATDEALMAAVRDGETRKLGVLFDRHHRPLLDFFRRITRDTAVSQDLVQEVFFRMLKYRSSYSGAGRFATWMYRIARNAQIDHFKNRPEDPIENEAKENAEGPRWKHPVERFEEERHAVLLEAALYRMTVEKRELIVLARYRQMPYDEIAGLLNIEVGAVKVRVHRALRELRDICLKLASETTPCDAKKSAKILPIT